MDIKRDIEARADIECFIRAFYEKAIADPVIGKIFTEVFPLNWAHHIPLITDFWETILLDNPVYKKNAMQVHYEMNNKFPFKQEHFDAWLHLFSETIDAMFEGEKAALAKKRALGIAQLMQLKMSTGNSSIPIK